MVNKKQWADGDIRSIFALRAEGAKYSKICKVMGIGSASVADVLMRRSGAEVHIDTKVLEMVEARYHGRKPVKPPVNPAMPQAMKAADPAYPVANTRNMLPDLEPPGTFHPGVVDALARQAANTQPEPVHTITKAQAMQDVLALVADGNEARTRVSSLRRQIIDMDKQAKHYEDKAFAAITKLGDMGFTPQVLNDFLTECGLCTDGLFPSG